MLLASLTFFWPVFHGRDLGFLFHDVSFVGRGGIEPLAVRPPGYNRLERPLLRTHPELGGRLSVDSVLDGCWESRHTSPVNPETTLGRSHASVLEVVEKFWT